MAENNTFENRVKAGHALRANAPRSSHGDVGNVKRDPIELLEKSSTGRVRQLVPLRYGRMLASPFAFYRGSAIIQAHDLATTPHTGLVQPICGDAHMMNFGGFATPERNFVFDMNDFDETHPGPWEWDVKRLAASFTVAARHLGFKATATDELVFNAIENYRVRMADFSLMGELDLWYEKLTFDYMLQNAKYEEGRKEIATAIEKAQKRKHENLLPKMADKTNGTWVMRDAPPGLFHIQGKNTLFDADDDWKQFDLQGALSRLLENYLTTLSPSHRDLLGRFQVQDVAFKVVGVGSVGTRCLVLLLTDVHDQPLFLQVKQAVPSVLAPYVPAGKSPFKHEGQRVVVGQRMMQSASDMFLGWNGGSGAKIRHFYIRQLRDMKFSVEVETLSELMFSRYAWLCSHILARSHARAGGLAPQISGYLGKSGQFAETLVSYANNYADQVERDFETFRAACRKGRLQAKTEADFAADLSI